MPTAPSKKDTVVPVSFVLNGEPRAVPTASTVGDLIRALALDEQAVAIERNREILTRPKWPRTPICAGDRIEIVHFVGGG